MWWNSSWAISNPERWCCESAALNMPANSEIAAVAMGLEKFSFHSNLRSNAKECPNYHTIAFISHASKVMLKILHARFQHDVNHELPDFHVGFRKDGRNRDQIAKCAGSSKKQESSRKHLFLLYWLCQSLWLGGSQQTVENSERDGNTRPPDLPPEKSICRSGRNS